MNDKHKILARLRAEINRIDDQLHDLLIKRSEIGHRVGQYKEEHKGPVVRPAREAQILRRLIKRHQGIMSKIDLIKIWQEILRSSVRQQGPFSIAVAKSTRCRPMVHDQFGSHTPIVDCQSPRCVLKTVIGNKASIGVLPLPFYSDMVPWWPFLVDDGIKEIVHIISRLPIARTGNCVDLEKDVLVIARLSQEPTGQDRTYFIIEEKTEIDHVQINKALNQIGLNVTFIAPWYDKKYSAMWFHLVEVDGFLAVGDEKLAHAKNMLGQSVKEISIVGGYAKPFTLKDLT